MSENKERIVDIDVGKEMRESFLEYSYSVIYSRALPDARDGLKPVQRRIIYQMGEMGLRPDRGHVKSARVTGEVMGKLHPHGDGAIYDALVRMSQPFTLRIPLIDGHGNFGSLDDGPAAARYTEARLAPAALLLNESLDEDTVDFEPNYDAQLTEPSVLPAAFPNLLVNGASGIAVGMATNMAPHNLKEVIAALVHLISNPNASTAELMEHIPGPDLPTGAVALVAESLREAYETGRGSFRMRARVSVESVGPRRTGLVVTELPYLVGPERVIDRIRDAVSAKKLEGIHNVVDLTDRDNGLRLVIELKTGFNPDSVMEALYRLTPLEEAFNVNNVALVNGRPQQLSLKQLLEVYLLHRLEVVRRRSESRLSRRRSRLHLLEGLQVAVLNIDEVIEVIRTSDTAELARTRLMQVFDLSELQADHILELRLRRLTRFSVIELETEADQLRKEISELQSLLESESLMKTTIRRELEEVSEKYGSPRRTQLIDSAGMVVSKKPVVVQELIDEPTFVCVTPTGKLYRTSNLPVDRQTLDARIIETTTRSDLALITSDGVAHSVHVADLPSISAAVTPDLPEPESLIGTKSSRVVGVIPWRSNMTFAIGTSGGVVKRFTGPLPEKQEVPVISLKEFDEVIGVCESTDGGEIAFVSSTGNLLIFNADTVRPQGLPASGMAGMNISEGRAIYFGNAIDDGVLVTAANSAMALGGTDAGSAKVTRLVAYPRKGRAAMGIRAHRFLKGEDQLYFATIAKSPARLFDLDEKRIQGPQTDDRRDGSGTPISTYLGGAL
ncbi:DNA topoisomerase IV subunit A [Aquiluna borgnonia]|uniref:DNA topoisomerase (ATP-hydrolyzing) n=1 Tax=Aquiluna borgnonia TaxID=2499157 RepID=A0A7D4PQK2_9MICO|nr:DNA topoisomerase IV subunit A [Aquiluna borgnonia]QKJ25226.1 DNA topoisomerase IV subunit A [Aquiluna borgnonia]